MSKKKASDIVVVPPKGTPEYREMFRTGQTLNGFPICGGNKNGVPCESILLHPNGRCSEHGGEAAVGPETHTFKTGLTSKYERYRIPAQLYEAYERAKDDPDYMDNQRELALLTGQIDALNNDLAAEADKHVKKGIRREIRDVIRLRASLSETQQKHEAHRDTHISYVEAMAMAKVLQDETRKLAYDVFGKEAREFLKQLEARWVKVLFNVGH